MNRRSFLKTSSGVIAAGVLAEFLPARPASATRLTILHTNDIHSHLDPMSAGEFAGMGGAEARSVFIAGMRARYPDLLLFDSGDMLQGTPYFNLFKGEPELKVMSAQGYLASTIGNHEFDPGLETLARQLKAHATFPILTANYDFSDTPMAGHTRESMVLTWNGLRIGVFGLGIKLKGLVSDDLAGATRYVEPVAVSRRVAQHLRNEEQCDFVICLSHASFTDRADGTYANPGDRQIAREVPEVDAILGGHNHFLLKRPERYKRKGFRTPSIINQVGWAGTHMGLLHFDLYDSHTAELVSGRPKGIS